MRVTPNSRFFGQPCSYVGTACAYEDYYGKSFPGGLPDGLKANGYLSLEGENRYLRSWLPVSKKVYFKRGERPLFRDFLRTNTARCCVCVFGHFVYVKGADYWSFFDNEEDEVVCVWYLKS